MSQYEDELPVDSVDAGISALRTDLGNWKWFFWALAAFLTIFQLYTALHGGYASLIQGAIHVGSGLGLIFLLYPAKRSLSSKRGVPWYDVFLAVATISVYFYVVANYDRIVSHALVFGFSKVDTVLAFLGIILLLEATRRCVGLPLAMVGVLALAYIVLGQYIPVFGHAGFSLERTANEMFFSTGAVFGTPIQVSSTYIFVFLFFGVVLVKTGLAEFFNELALSATGRYSGGTAKAAVVASGFQGMISGSSIANTVTSGSFTIPMMKRAGFRAQFAGATEAAASTGGQTMPPIMGAAAFIMAEYTGIAYIHIALIAVIPSVLYFLSVFIGIHFESKKQGIVGLPKSSMPSLARVASRSYMLLPIVGILWVLSRGGTPQRAALWGIALALIVSLIRRDTRLSIGDVIKLLEEGARVALPVIAACATAGLVVGAVTKTGLGSKFAGGLLDLSGGNVALLLVFTMVACVILGMGLPTTANYVVTATVAAPVLLNVGIPLIASHMFVFYFGIMADITPPVCLAAFAGAGIAKADPLKTGWTALTLAIAGFLIPYVFVLHPGVLLVDPTIINLVLPVLLAICGVTIISSGLVGYFFGSATYLERALLVVAGPLVAIGLVKTVPLGAILLGIVIFIRFLRRNHRDDDGSQTCERSVDTSSRIGER